MYLGIHSPWITILTIVHLDSSIPFPHERVLDQGHPPLADRLTRLRYRKVRVSNLPAPRQPFPSPDRVLFAVRQGRRRVNRALPARVAQTLRSLRCRACLIETAPTTRKAREIQPHPIQSSRSCSLHHLDLQQLQIFRSVDADRRRTRLDDLYLDA